MPPIDFSNPKHRFKVDVNAQQHFLSGIVILYQDTNLNLNEDEEFQTNSNNKIRDGYNLVIVEGGPKGVQRFVKLMTKRYVNDLLYPTSSTIGQTSS
jgi:U4/U6 small nuclear ribonucleoprotein PRP3